MAPTPQHVRPAPGNPGQASGSPQLDASTRVVHCRACCRSKKRSARFLGGCVCCRASAWTCSPRSVACWRSPFAPRAAFRHGRTPPWMATRCAPRMRGPRRPCAWSVALSPAACRRARSASSRRCASSPARRCRAAPTPAQIPNSNTYSLMAQVMEIGGLPLNLGVVPDRLDAIAERIARGAEADVLVSSAGVSVGELDLVREALVNAGAELHLWKVDMRPGKPMTFGSLGGKPVFGLPGNPVSAMVTFELFVRPMLLAMQGRRGTGRLTVRATALAPIVNRGSRRGYLRVVLEARDGRWGARLTGEQGSGILRSMVSADGLAVLRGDTAVAAGEDVEVIVLREVSP